MEKRLSVRVDEWVIRKIDALAKQMGATRKAIIEKAVRL